MFNSGMLPVPVVLQNCVSFADVSICASASINMKVFYHMIYYGGCCSCIDSIYILLLLFILFITLLLFPDVSLTFFLYSRLFESHFRFLWYFALFSFQQLILFPHSLSVTVTMAVLLLVSWSSMSIFSTRTFKCFKLGSILIAWFKRVSPFLFSPDCLLEIFPLSNYFCITFFRRTIEKWI